MSSIFTFVWRFDWQVYDRFEKWCQASTSMNQLMLTFVSFAFYFPDFEKFGPNLPHIWKGAWQTALWEKGSLLQ